MKHLNESSKNKKKKKHFSPKEKQNAFAQWSKESFRFFFVLHITLMAVVFDCFAKVVSVERVVIEIPFDHVHAFDAVADHTNDDD